MTDNSWREAIEFLRKSCPSSALEYINHLESFFEGQEVSARRSATTIPCGELEEEYEPHD